MFTADTTHPDNTAEASVLTTPDPRSTPDAPRARVDARPARRPRRRMRRAAIIAGAAVAVCGVVVLVDLATDESTTTTSRFDQHVERLRIDVANGDVEIIGSDDPEVTIEITTHGGLRTPHHDESVGDGTLRIDAGCGLNPFSPTCSIDYVIHAPRGVDVVARGSGTDYDLRDLAGDVDIALDGGDSDLTFAATPNLVRARGDGGDIDITVPAGAAHRVLAGSDGGSTRVEIATDPDSPHVIDAHANGGDVTITRSTPTAPRDAP